MTHDARTLGSRTSIRAACQRDVTRTRITPGKTLGGWLVVDQLPRVAVHSGPCTSRWSASTAAGCSVRWPSAPVRLGGALHVEVRGRERAPRDTEAGSRCEIALWWPAHRCALHATEWRCAGNSTARCTSSTSSSTRTTTTRPRVSPLPRPRHVAHGWRSTHQLFRARCRAVGDRHAETSARRPPLDGDTGAAGQGTPQASERSERALDARCSVCRLTSGVARAVDHWRVRRGVRR